MVGVFLRPLPRVFKHPPAPCPHMQLMSWSTRRAALTQCTPRARTVPLANRSAPTRGTIPHLHPQRPREHGRVEYWPAIVIVPGLPHVMLIVPGLPPPLSYQDYHILDAGPPFFSGHG